MDSFVLMLIATSAFISIKADDEPQIEVYEIRKTRDDPDLLDFRLDYDYHDPNEDIRVDNSQYDKHKLNNRAINKNKNINADIVTNNLLDKLRRIVNSKYYDSNRNENEDYITSYKNLKKGNIFEDGKTPVVIIADNRLLYHLIPQKSTNFQNKLQSVLRSINFGNEIEDRTAPPRTRIVYDYVYD